MSLWPSFLCWGPWNILVSKCLWIEAWDSKDRTYEKGNTCLWNVSGQGRLRQALIGQLWIFIAFLLLPSQLHIWQNLTRSRKGWMIAHCLSGGTNPDSGWNFILKMTYFNSQCTLWFSWAASLVDHVICEAYHCIPISKITFSGGVLGRMCRC